MRLSPLSRLLSLPSPPLRARFVLEAMYAGTYLSAIAHKRTSLFLTLVGGGAFGNDKRWIYETLFNIHARMGRHPQNTIKKVRSFPSSPYSSLPR